MLDDFSSTEDVLDFRVTANRRHESLTISEMGRWFLSRLDGDRDPRALREVFGGAVACGELVVRRDALLIS